MIPRINCRRQRFQISLVKKELFMTLVKMIRQTLFKAIMIGIGTAAMVFCRRGERLGSTSNTTGKEGIYSRVCGAVVGQWIENY